MGIQTPDLGLRVYSLIRCRRHTVSYSKTIPKNLAPLGFYVESQVGTQPFSFASVAACFGRRGVGRNADSARPSKTTRTPRGGQQEYLSTLLGRKTGFLQAASSADFWGLRTGAGEAKVFGHLLKEVPFQALAAGLVRHCRSKHLL